MHPIILFESSHPGLLMRRGSPCQRNTIAGVGMTLYLEANSLHLMASTRNIFPTESSDDFSLKFLNSLAVNKDGGKTLW